MSAKIVENRAADEAARADFVNSLSTKQSHSPNEISIITQTEQTLSTKDNAEILVDSPFFPKFVNVREGIVIGTCTGVVQTSPEELTAFMYLTNTHEVREAHIADNGPDSSKYPNKTIRVINDHHKITYSCRKLPPPMNPREWLTRNIIQRVDTNTIKYFATSIHDDDPDLPLRFAKTTLTNIVRGEISMTHEYERLPHNQTIFTLRLKVDIKGNIPKKIANMGMSGALDSVYRAYKYFKRDEEIDELEVSLTEKMQARGSTDKPPANPLSARLSLRSTKSNQRSSFIDSIPSTPETSTEEKSLISRSMAYTTKDKLTTTSTGTIRGNLWTRLHDGDSSVKKFKKMKEGDPSMWGKATAIVHTTAEQALAFVWLYCSNLRMKEHQKLDGNLIREVYEPITTTYTATVPSAQHHTQHIVVQKSMPQPFQPRESNMRFVWSETNSSNKNDINNEENSKILIMAFEPAEIKHVSEKRVQTAISKLRSKVNKQKSNSSVHPANDGEEEQSLGVAQLETKGVWVITPLAQNVCEVTLVTNIVDKGKIPSSMVNAKMGSALNAVTFLRAFYERTGLVVDAEVRLEAREMEQTEHPLLNLPTQFSLRSRAAASRVRQELSQNGEFNH